MALILRGAAFLLVTLTVAATAPTASAQAPSSTPTASPASDSDAAETAPRRRPLRRAAARPAFRSRPARRAPSGRDTLTVDFVPVSSRVGRAEALAVRTARLDASLRGDAPRWLGIPYRWGGSTRQGIDCSAFVQQYVRDNLGVALTRTTAGQRYEGIEIGRDELRAGDLVFFRRRGVRHVGVYLSGGEFIHASSSRGVTISDVTSGYWDRHYWMSRRVIPAPPAGALPGPRSLARRDTTGARG